VKVAIIGLGLIGGSIGLALKERSKDIKVVGIPRREETIREALDRGAVDEGTTDHRKGVRDADIVFICTPINRIIPILKEIASEVKNGAVVTDVGSTKESIVSQAEKIMPKDAYFVGGHPMAGKEEVKLEAAEPGLFEGKTWILTATPKTSKKALETVKEVVRLLGGLVVRMEPKLHDLAVAGISHMPLALAAALVNTIGDSKKGKQEMRLCAASGFRDTTRIASGDPILGVDMFTTNKKAVLKMISGFKKSLSRLEKHIKAADPKMIKRELKRAKDLRDSIYG
jgi:prephenate dehydrogenase